MVGAKSFELVVRDIASLVMPRKYHIAAEDAHFFVDCNKVHFGITPSFSHIVSAKLDLRLRDVCHGLVLVSRSCELWIKAVSNYHWFDGLWQAEGVGGGRKGRGVGGPVGCRGGATHKRQRIGVPRTRSSRHIHSNPCLLYTSPSPRDLSTSRMPSSA